MVNGNGLLSTKETVLADIRDADAIRRVFEEYRPEVVFHAAALKHLPMLERYPEEGWKTNVVGTLNVLEAAASVGVERFVNISTDKAANPTSVLGHTKRAAEQLTAWMGQQAEGRYLSVRFGNVIGSRGSMLPTFTRLIEQGGPLTVTHPDVTRYFMTIPEACQLVLQAGGIGHSGEVMILDMGEPVRILDVAKRMIALSGKDIDIVFTGLRDGEKLNEELTADTELTQPSAHPLISRTVIEPLPITEVTYLVKRHESTELAMTQTQPASIPITCPPSIEPIALSNPDVGPLEEQAVLEALRSGWVAPAGPDLNAFETEMAQRVGVDHAVGFVLGHSSTASWDCWHWE